MQTLNWATATPSRARTEFVTDRYRLTLEPGAIVDASTALSDLFTFIGKVYDELAEQWQVPPIEVSVVVTDDFHSEVDRTLAMRAADTAHPTEQVAPYDSTRLGGVAIAKNIVLSRDGSDVRIVVNSTCLGPADDAPSNLWAVFLIAHELAHPILGRRRAGGSPNCEPVRLIAHVAARTIVRSALDEMNADLLADGVLKHFGSVTIDGQEPRPVRVTDLIVGHRLQVAEVLDSHVHPGWADLVDACRTNQISLDDLWTRIASQTDQMMTLLGHAEAEARCLEQPGPLDAECADHPGARLYLTDAWQRIMRACESTKFSIDPDVIRQQNEALLDEGEAALLEMWATLGLTFELDPGNRMYIHLAEPAR